MDGARGAPLELGERAFESLGAFFDREERGQRGGEEIALRDAAQFFEIAVGEDGVLELERVAVLRSFGENVALDADVTAQRHHQLFADRIDGRISNLREELLEVIEERLRLIGETGERRIGAHGADGLLAIGGHGSEDEADIFIGVAEGALAGQDAGGFDGVLARRLGKAFERDLVFLEPKLIGIAAV